MGNGIEQDVREVRALAQRIDSKGCGHREAHEKSVDDIWSALSREKTAREGAFVKVIIVVLVIVLGAMIGNIFATSAVVEQAVTSAIKAQTTIGRTIPGSP